MGRGAVVLSVVGCLALAGCSGGAETGVTEGVEPVPSPPPPPPPPEPDGDDGGEVPPEVGPIPPQPEPDDGDGPEEVEPLPFPPEPRTLAEMQASQAELEAGIEDVAYTNPADLPTTGSADYRGELSLLSFGEPGFPYEMSADMRLAVDFEDSSVSAEATNFSGQYGLDEEPEAVEGRITFSGGTIDRGVDPDGGGWTYDLPEAGGSLTVRDGTEYAVVAGSLVGDFRGEDHEHADGEQFVRWYAAPEDRGAMADGEFAARR